MRLTRRLASVEADSWLNILSSNTYDFFDNVDQAKNQVLQLQVCSFD